MELKPLKIKKNGQKYNLTVKWKLILVLLHKHNFIFLAQTFLYFKSNKCFRNENRK